MSDGGEDPRALTPERVDRLLGHLPTFEDPEVLRDLAWRGGRSAEDQVLHFPFPVYPEPVLAFFAEAGKPWWSDYGYEPGEAGRMLADDRVVARAGYAEIRTMLTFCVRGERFCDGHWAAVVEEGRVLALLRRLRELRDAERAVGDTAP